MSQMNFTECKAGCVIFFETFQNGATPYQAKFLSANPDLNEIKVEIILGGFGEFKGQKMTFYAKDFKTFECFPELPIE